MRSGQGFEEEVLALVKHMGFEATLTKASGDGGIDILAINNDPLTQGKYIIQCKDWSNPVGESVVRDLYGVVAAERANKGILITTGTFTRAAHTFAEGKPLELIDGTHYQGLVRKYLGKKMSVSQVDADPELQELQAQVEANPRNILARKRLGDLYLLAREWDRAEREYRAIIENPPDRQVSERLWQVFLFAQTNWAIAKCMRLELAEGIDVLMDCLRRFDFKSYTFAIPESLGILFHYVGMHDQAIAYYKQVIGELTNLNSEYLQDLEERIDYAYVHQDLKVYVLPVVLLNEEGKHTFGGLSLPNAFDILPPTIRRLLGLLAGCQHLVKLLTDACASPSLNWSDEDEDFVYQPSSEQLNELGRQAIDVRQQADQLETMAGIPEEAFPIVHVSRSLAGAVVDFLQAIIQQFGEVLKEPVEDQRYLEAEWVRVTKIPATINSVLDEYFLALDTFESKLLQPAVKEAEDKLIAAKEQARSELTHVATAPVAAANPAHESASGSRSEPRSQSCFVATAVYEDPKCAPVVTLRQWRDEVLQVSPAGQAFIRWYYRNGPALARWVNSHPLIRQAMRTALDAFVNWIKR